MRQLIRAILDALVGVASEATAQIQRLVRALAGLAATSWFVLVPVVAAVLLIAAAVRHGFDVGLTLRFFGLLFSFGSAVNVLRKKRAQQPLTLLEEGSAAGGFTVGWMIFLYQFWAVMA